MITASALAPHCAFAKVLGNQKQRTPEQQAAIDQGTRFHAFVEQRIKEGVMPVIDEPEVQGWMDLIDSTDIPIGRREVLCEVAWGLLEDGRSIHVDEPEPHVYVAHQRASWKLLTAGRADLAWALADDLIAVVDVKTGKWPVTAAPANLQVNAAGQALTQMIGVSGYVPGVYYARDGHLDWGEPVKVLTLEWVAMWEQIRRAASLPLEPLPGPHCASCWERKQCPAAQR